MSQIFHQETIFHQKLVFRDLLRGFVRTTVPAKKVRSLSLYRFQPDPTTLNLEKNRGRGVGVQDCPQEWVLTHNFAKFSKKLHEIEKFLGPSGASARDAQTD